jgi:hypothetical protein
MKKNKKKTRFVLKSKWQTLLEFIAITSIMLIVSSVDSEWTKEYFQFVGILTITFTTCVLLIKKFGNPKRYQED